MAVPTTASRTNSADVASEARSLHTRIDYVRQLAVTWQANLAAGNMSVESIINGLYIPLAASVNLSGVWRTVTAARALPGFTPEYLSAAGLWFEFGPAEVLLPGDRLVIGENEFAVSDRVRMQQRDTLPTPFAEATDYWVNTKPTAQAITLRATSGGSADIDITAKGSGLNIIRYAVNVDLNTLETALEAAIDQIIADVPTAAGGEILSRSFDKTLASGTNGTADEVMTPAQTADIRTDLAAIQNAIEAPA